MRIAFYAPMKSPYHPRPSGDRRLGRLLIQALRRAGHQVEVASNLRAWEGRGAMWQQREIQQQGLIEAAALLTKYRGLPVEARPAAWVTYHLYHKAPDWIGPRVAAGLNIPYLVAEASYAPKKRTGAWALGFQAAEEALQSAAAVIVVNPADLGALQRIPGMNEKFRLLEPFLDLEPLAQQGSTPREVLAERYDLQRDSSWLLAVGLMRDDAKLRSYRLLAQAAMALQNRSWQLLLVGDGPAEVKVRRAFAALGPARIRWPGLLPNREVHTLMAAADLFVWPAIDEAFGMAILEAQACGLPVVAGESGGVGAIVEDGVTGSLLPVGDYKAIARTVDHLLFDTERRRTMAEMARQKVRRQHGLQAASEKLDAILCEAVAQGST